MALHATTIRFADRAYLAIARAADSQGISVSQYVREAALIRAVLDELDSAEEALHSADDLLAIAREVRRLADVDPPGPPRANAGRKPRASAKLRRQRLAKRSTRARNHYRICCMRQRRDGHEAGARRLPMCVRGSP